MRKPQFIPGPWKKARSKTKILNENWNFITIYSVNIFSPIGKAIIAMIPFVPDDKMKVKQAEANASLIEQASELYEYLHEAAYETCTRSGSEHCPYFDSEKMTCSNKDGECFVQKWLKTLKKARGEA